MEFKIINSPLKNGVKKITSDYKTRNKLRSNHNGIDLISGSLVDNYIIAIEDGVISSTGYDSKSGYYVFIKHENGYRSFYCHLLKSSIVVQKNQKVLKGDRIATMGSTGSSSGTHLHFAVKSDKNKWVDPKPYLEGTSSFKTSLTFGDYITLKKKYLRKNPYVGNNKVKYVNLSKNAKTKCDNINSYARYKIGASINIKEFSTDQYGNIWGRTNNTWLCVKDETGMQVRKV